MLYKYCLLVQLLKTDKKIYKDKTYLNDCAIDLCTTDICSYNVSTLEYVLEHISQGKNFFSRGLSGPVKSTVSTLYNKIINQY